MQTINLRQTTENNGGHCSSKNYAYLQRQKATPSGPDQASICDELRVRTCCYIRNT